MREDVFDRILPFSKVIQPLTRGLRQKGFRASQTHLCKVKFQLTKYNLVIKLPAIANPQNLVRKSRDIVINLNIFNKTQ